MGNSKKKLRELSLYLLKSLTEAVVFRMSYVYENLNVLDLGGVSLAVTDNSLQMIFRHMRLLRFLNVDSCCKVIFQFYMLASRDLQTSNFHAKSLQITVSLVCLQNMRVVFIP